MRLSSTDGIELVVHDLGGDGPPALLAHATGFHGRVWAPMAAHLSDVLHAWAPDLRGHGDSFTPPGHPFRWESFADDVLAVVDGVGLDQPIGIGHSKGGAALLLAEQRRPGTFRALWCFEPVVMPPFGGSEPRGENPLAIGASRRRDVFESYDAAIANFSGKPPLDVFDPDALREYVTHGFARQPDGTVRLKCRPEDEARTYTMGATHDAFEHLGEVRCPVLIVRGAIEDPGPAAFAAAQAAALPNGRLEVHDDLGHFAPMQAPERMATSVRAVPRDADRRLMIDAQLPGGG